MKLVLPKANDRDKYINRIKEKKRNQKREL